MPRYLAWLQGRLQALGGTLELRALRSLDEALDAAATVVNCAGLGARELCADARLQPVRGQVVRVAQPGLRRFLVDDYGPEGMTYVIPRCGDVVLGGTAEEGAEDLRPDPDAAAAILRRAVVLEPALAGAAVLGTAVGLRPCRDSVRLEPELRGPGRRVVHNYGHGGAGVTLSWGCALEVVQRVGALDAEAGLGL
jgi:D-amino-acid oxidase